VDNNNQDFENYISDSDSSGGNTRNSEAFRNSVVTIMSQQEGREFIYRMLEFTGFTHECIHSEPTMLGYNVGKQSVGNWLFSTIQSECPEYYRTMQTEMKELENERNSNTTSS